MKSRSPSTTREKGASLVEYSLLAGLVAVVSIGAVRGTGLEVAEVYCRATSSLDRAMGGEGFDCDAPAEVGRLPGGGSGDVVSPSDDDWDLTDESPDPFEFIDVYGADPNTLFTSNTVTLTGFNETLPARAYSGALFSINGGAFAQTGEVAAGDAIALQALSHEAHDSTRSYLFRVGGYQTSWKIRTNVGDMTPDDFAFTDLFGVAPDSYNFSESFRLSGVAQPISVSSSSSHVTWQRFNEAVQRWQDLPNGREVEAGDLLRLEGRAASNLGETRNFAVGLGEGTATWNITTQETWDYPEFAFIDQYDLEFREPHFSNEITLSGLTTPAKLTFPTINSSRFDISINDFDHQIGSGSTHFWVENGDRIQLEANFSQTYPFGQQIDAGVEISGTSDVWTLTFTDGLKSVAMADLTDLTDAKIRENYRQERVVSGFNGIARLDGGDTYFDIEVNGQPAGRNAAIRSGDTLAFIMRSATRPSETDTYSFDLGDRTLDWSITTEDQRLPVLSNLEDPIRGAVDDIVFSTFDLSGANYKSYIEAESDWGGHVAISGDSGFTSGAASFSDDQMTGQLRFKMPSGGGAITLKVRNTASEGSADMQELYTVNVAPGSSF